MAEACVAHEVFVWVIPCVVEVLREMVCKLKEEMINFNLEVLMHAQGVEKVIFLDGEAPQVVVLSLEPHLVAWSTH